MDERCEHGGCIQPVEHGTRFCIGHLRDLAAELLGTSLSHRCLAIRGDGELCLDDVSGELHAPNWRNPTNLPGGVRLCPYHLHLAKKGLLDMWDELRRPAFEKQIRLELKRERELDLVRRKSWIYYGRRRSDGLIKIGRSRRLRTRVQAQELELLAVEPGAERLEEKRLAQFSGCRAHEKRDLFRADPDLLAWIEKVRSRHELPPEALSLATVG